jgi:hypothetical protein
MDTRIPLGVQGIDFAGSMMNGLTAGTAARDAQQQNALMQLYRQQGPQIMAGDPNALNSLAQFDPTAAQGVQMNNLGMQQTQLGMENTRLQMEETRRQAKAEAQAAAAKVEAADLAAAIDRTKNLMASVAGDIVAWQGGDQAAGQRAASILTQAGIPGVTPDNLMQIIYGVQGGFEGLQLGLEAQKSMQGLMPQGPEWSAATPEQAAKYGAAGGQINTATGEFKPINPPSGGIQFDPETGRVVSIGGAAGSGKPATEAEGKNAGFLIRMRDSNLTLDNLEAQGTDLMASIMSNDPTGLSNYAQTPEYQLYDQAKRDFINAQLRRESGAVISPQEFANAEVQYFPRPGDSPEVIAQKRKNRENAIAGVTVGAGASAQNPIVSGSQGVATAPNDFANMNLGQLTNVDITALTPEQQAALSARLKELGF